MAGARVPQPVEIDAPGWGTPPFLRTGARMAGTGLQGLTTLSIDFKAQSSELTETVVSTTAHAFGVSLVVSWVPPSLYPAT